MQLSLEGMEDQWHKLPHLFLQASQDLLFCSGTEMIVVNVAQGELWYGLTGVIIWQLSLDVE